MRHRANGIGASILLALAMLAGGSRMAVAQGSSVRPDAMILVQPAGDHAVLSVSYAGKVSHAKAREALTHLSKLGGWRMTTPEVSDVDMKSNARYGPVMALGVQTGATALISGAPLANGGGFILQPFVDAFRDLKSYKLLIWVAPQPGFQGLRRFENRDVSVELIQEGGPYRYSVVNHTHQGAAPKLPLTQQAPSNLAAVAPAEPPAPRNDLKAVGPVVAIAMGSGLAVFVLLRLLSIAKNRGRNAATSGRNGSRDPGRTSRI